MKKNVIVILCDQLRKDCLGCYGNPYVRTPNIDSLSQKGIRFTRSYVANPICMPNRLSLFSGMYPRNHGLWTNGLLIKDEGYTLMHHLSNSGYQTASIGKIHFEPVGCDADSGSAESSALWTQHPEMEQFHGPFWGFDYIDLHDAHGTVSHHMLKWYAENGGSIDMLAADSHGVRDLPNRLHSSAFVGERAVNYLQNIRDKEKPFFLVASFPDPHAPFVASKESMETRSYNDVPESKGKPEDLYSRPAHYRLHLDGAWDRSGIHNPEHPGGISENIRKKRIAHTYAMIDLIDENIGRILASLNEQGLSDDTIIIFTSDHGELLGDHGLWLKGPFFYEGLLSTPLIVTIPGQPNAPVASDALFSAVDLAPTICELLGTDIPFYMDGISQFPVIDGKKTQLRENCLVEYRNGYYENDCNSKVLITPDYKYVRYQTGERELTDIKNDPDERKNVSGTSEYKEIEEKLADELMTELLKTESKKPYQLCLA